MRINKLQFPCFEPYGKATAEVYFAGCKRLCKGCHNPELQDFSCGENASNKHIRYMLDRISYIRAISFLGGEPLDQQKFAVQGFVETLQAFLPGKEFWLFTGYEFKDVPKWCLENFDYIKVGEYREELKQEGFPASSNQKLLTRGKDY
jgi:anaerobic ribonucleoside-triphosphate reductase activating protein